jgi:site-specific recombinase XerD
MHDLRHSFASILVSGGKSLQIVSKILGHTNAATTNRYAHLLVDPLREAAKKKCRRRDRCRQAAAPEPPTVKFV